MPQRETKKVFLPDNPTQPVQGWMLTEDEIGLLDQFLQSLSAGSPLLEAEINRMKPDIQNYLSYVMAINSKPFVGMRKATGAIGVTALYPLHLDTNVADWRYNPATLAAAGWTTRSNGSGTAWMSGATIANDIWPVILGVQVGHDITNIAGADYNKKPTRIRYTVDGVTTLPVDLYSSGIAGVNNTKFIPVPMLFVPEKSVFTEQAYFPAAITTANQKFWIREVGLTFGIGSVLAGI